MNRGLPVISDHRQSNIGRVPKQVQRTALWPNGTKSRPSVDRANYAETLLCAVQPQLLFYGASIPLSVKHIFSARFRLGEWLYAVGGRIRWFLLPKSASFSHSKQPNFVQEGADYSRSPFASPMS